MGRKELSLGKTHFKLQKHSESLINIIIEYDLCVKVNTIDMVWLTKTMLNAIQSKGLFIV